MTVTDQEFRDVGFTGEARNYPRDEFALVLFAAFNNVTVEQLTPAMRYHPNGATEAAWKRVADAASDFCIQAILRLPAHYDTGDCAIAIRQAVSAPFPDGYPEALRPWPKTEPKL